MKRAMIAVFVLLVLGTTVWAQPGRKLNDLRRIANEAGNGFGYDFRPLDRKGLRQGAVTVLFQHWITDIGQREYESRRFASFSAIERWLRAHTNKEDNTPFRVAGKVLNCTRSRCTVEITNGYQHNHLFLKRVWFGYAHGKPYINKLHLVYG